jgi:hypothetical protein
MKTRLDLHIAFLDKYNIGYHIIDHRAPHMLMITYDDHEWQSFFDIENEEFIYIDKEEK